MDPSRTQSWQDSELDSVINNLSRTFPDRPARDIVFVVTFCKGAVRRRQGIDTLESFAAGLLRPSVSRKMDLAPGW